MADSEDPVLASWFSLDFGGKIVGAFREVTGMGSKSEIVEYKGTSEDGKQYVSKTPGRLSVNDVTLKRGLTSAKDMWDWRQEVVDGNMSEARRDCTIKLHRPDNSVVAIWNFYNAWPSGINGPAPNASQNETAIEELVICADRMEREQ
jgi:phage tail-like protein